MSAQVYGSAREGREHFKDLLDSAAAGRPTAVLRENRRFAALDADRFIDFLAKVTPARAHVVAEADGWSVFLDGYPIAADGADLAEALDETIAALRDYAEAWVERLHQAPNHADNWGLVQLISLASDGQLRAWLQGEPVA